MHKAIINSNVKIGSNCIINTKSLIEHDCVIGDNSHIATSVNINGHVKIGKKLFHRFQCYAYTFGKNKG